MKPAISITCHKAYLGSNRFDLVVFLSLLFFYSKFGIKVSVGYIPQNAFILCDLPLQINRPFIHICIDVGKCESFDVGLMIREPIIHPHSLHYNL